MKLRFFLILHAVFMLSVLMVSANGQDTLEPIRKAREFAAVGEWDQARNLLEDEASRAPEDQAKALLWEKERLRRVPMDYDMTRDDVWKQIQEKIALVTEEEFQLWEKEGRFDTIQKDGVTLYMGSSVSNLGKRYPEIRRRFKNFNREDPWGKKVLAMARRVQTEAGETTSALATPLLLKVTQGLGPKEGRARDGQTVRGWIPFPRETEYQTDIKVISTSPQYANLDRPDSDIRSVYYEQKIAGTQIPFFTMEYEFIRKGIFNRMDPTMAAGYGGDPIFTEFTKEEAPHIVFTPELKYLSHLIVGGETNPCIKAKKIYDWICDNTVYSYAREYSTILNIPMYVYENRYGDCGQEALFFITLCRIAGVPAAWRSGWECMGGDRYGMHDWTSVYIEPWGWVPADPYMGVWAIQESTLPDEDRQYLRDFYFGSMDPWRLEANARNNAELNPEKYDFRSEPVDFQRGEVEVDGANLYFNEFRRKMSLTVVDDASTSPSGTR